MASKKTPEHFTNLSPMRGGGSSKLPQQLLRRLLEVCCRCSLFNVEWNGAPYLRSDYTGGVIRLHRRCDDAMTF